MVGYVANLCVYFSLNLNEIAFLVHDWSNHLKILIITQPDCLFQLSADWDIVMFSGNGQEHEGSGTHIYG